MLELIDHGRVREICLDRPPVNALNPQLVTELTAALNTAAAECDAVVLSGRPGMFSAGLDVPELLGLERETMARFWRAFHGLMETLARAPIPVAAAITGHSPAGGAVLALFCDTRIMSRGSYRIGLNETQVGLTLPAPVHQALVRLVGAHRAEQLIVSAALLLPEEALQAGFVDQLADTPEAAVEAAVAWCARLGSLPAHAMQANRRLLRESLTRLFDGSGGADNEDFLKVWFDPRTQATLQALVAALKARKAP